MENEMEIQFKQRLRQNNRRWLGALVIVGIVCIAAGISYALFTFNQPGEKNNEVRTGTLIVTLEDKNAIEIDKAVPMSDDAGSAQQPYTFTLSNTGTLNSKYRIKLVDDTEAIAEEGCGNNLLDHSKVRYLLTIDGEAQEPQNLGGLVDDVIEESSIASGASPKVYELRLWLDSAIEDPDEIAQKHLHVRIEVEAIQDQYVDFDTINE